MADATWTDSKFERVIKHGDSTAKVQVRGPTYKGLGICRSMAEVGVWYVIHLGTGHGIARIQASEERTKFISATLAEIGDWDWTDPVNGWRNRDPEIWQKLSFLLSKFPEASGGSGTSLIDLGLAREIGSART